MSTVRQHKRLLAWFSAIALMCNMLAGAFGLAQAKAAPAADDVLGALIICTSDGAKADPRGEGGSHRQNPAEHCLTCVLHANVALAAAVMGLGVAFSTPRAARPIPMRSGSPAVHLSLGGIGSRAPPHSA